MTYRSIINVYNRVYIVCIGFSSKHYLIIQFPPENRDGHRTDNSRSMAASREWIEPTRYRRMCPLHSGEREDMDSKVSGLLRNVIIVVTTAQDVHIATDKFCCVSVPRSGLNTRAYQYSPLHIYKVKAPEIIHRTPCPTSEDSYFIGTYLTARVLRSGLRFALQISQYYWFAVLNYMDRHCFHLVSKKISWVQTNLQIQLCDNKVRKYIASSVSSKALFFLPLRLDAMKLLSIPANPDIFELGLSPASSSLVTAPTVSGSSNSKVPPLIMPPYTISLGGCISISVAL